MRNPKELSYSKSHEWVKFTGDTSAIIGITDYAQDSLGDIVFINLPDEGEEVIKEEVFGDIESVKAVSDLISPVSGGIVAVNEALLEEPELINDDPYENWILKIENITETEDLLDAEEYADFCEEED